MTKPLEPTAARHPASRDIAVSIVIVSWNVRDLLRSCLRSVETEMETCRKRYEVVVVDNASEDGSTAMVKQEFPRVTLMEGRENVGFARANNQALPHCHGTYVLLLNPDTEVLDGAIGKMVAHLEAHPDIGALGCRLLNTDGSFQRWTAGVFPSVSAAARHAFFIDRLFSNRSSGRSLYLSRDVDHDMDVDWVSGACMLLRRSALGDTIFDESFFMYGEDNELCARLAAAGWRVTYTPCASVLHHHGRSMAKQSGAVLLSSFKGPRAFFIRQNGKRWVWAYDTMIAAGFGLRWGLYRAASMVDRRHADRATLMRSLFSRAMQVMRGR